MTLVQKIRRAKKAVNGVLAATGTMVAAVAPSIDTEFKLGVGVVGSVFTGLIIYFSTNEE